MSFFSGLDFFITLIIAIIPAIVIGLNGKSLRYYRGFLTCIFIYLIYRNSLMELAFLTGYSAMSLGLVKLYLLSRIKMGRNKFFYASAVIITLCPLILSKLESFVGHGFFGSGSTIFGFLGLSYIFFRVIQTIIEIYDGIINEIKWYEFLEFLLFFPTLSSGPIDRSRRFSQDYSKIYTGKEYSELLSNGIVKIMWGLLYKLPLSGTAMYIMNTYMINKYDPIHIIGYAYSYGLYMFFDFAGYSDMAIGLSEMFGYHCMENFNYPYMTESVAKFWRRWHISLSQWFRDYIYIPLGGSRTKSKGRVYINMLAVWLATGIWHGAAWNFVVWGLGFFILIAFEKVTGFPDTFKSKGMKIAYRIFTLFFINFEWVIFRAKDLKTAVIYIQNMFMFQKHTISDLRTMFIIKDYFWIILFAIVLSFPVVSNLRKRFEGKEELCRIYDAVIGILVIVLFIWAITFAVVGQNNPFAYANF